MICYERLGLLMVLLWRAGGTYMPHKGSRLGWCQEQARRGPRCREGRLSCWHWMHRVRRGSSSRGGPRLDGRTYEMVGCETLRL